VALDLTDDSTWAVPRRSSRCAPLARLTHLQGPCASIALRRNESSCARLNRQPLDHCARHATAPAAGKGYRAAAEPQRAGVSEFRQPRRGWQQDPDTSSALVCLPRSKRPKPVSCVPWLKQRRASSVPVCRSAPSRANTERRPAPSARTVEAVSARNGRQPLRVMTVYIVQGPVKQSGICLNGPRSPGGTQPGQSA